ncbi:solute carrier family 35 member F2-like isoform X1 [Stegostoma tigrinum]|uniref:solute carrier family 35 member F2-like isoform X1 n=2 Tax=Stegostoma tigrinum TaxID=3053191 RepID=UPI00202ACFD8|nr:solute carrier family 35 member F2-like isoform X1 [Stegostoma tigrinum]
MFLQALSTFTKKREIAACVPSIPKASQALYDIVMDSNEGINQTPSKIKIFFSNLMEKSKAKEYFTWNLLKILFLGQGLSMLLCGTAISSQYLADDFAVNTPVLQSFINYLLLCLVYVGILAFRQGNDNLLQILKTKWWKYLLVGLIDVEANYLVVKAYQYTTLTSVQLLDCFIIPVVMLLSWFILRSRYKIIHFVAVLMCLLGVGIMVGADVLASKQQGSGSNKLLGDFLVLGGAALYGVSNVCEEFVVKNFSREEFLGMLGLFGTFFSGIQLSILEHNAIANINWSWQVVLLFTAFAVCMFGWYSFLPLVIKISSATSVNLAILTADLYSIFFGIFLFHYKFSVLYILAFAIIMVGFVLYNTTPSHVAEVQIRHQTAASGFDDSVRVNYINTQEPTIQFTSMDYPVVTEVQL